MSKNKHDSESLGAKPRERAHSPYHFLKHPHRDWRVWLVVALMLVCMAIYILSDNESLRPGNSTNQPMPAENAP